MRTSRRPSGKKERAKRDEMTQMIMSRFPASTGWGTSGFFVGDGTDQKALTAQEAIERANINWTVSKRDIYYQGEDKGTLMLDDSHKAVVRDKDNTRLGIVKNGYMPIQNIEAFKFLDGLAKSGDIAYHSVGTFHGGRRVWMLAKIGESEILPQDMLDHYILMYNSHDGSSSLTAALTAIRIACTNAILSMLNKDRHSMGVNIRHTKNAHSYMDDARNILKLARERSVEMEELGKRMTRIRMSDKKFKRIAYRLFPDPPADATDRARTNAEDRRILLTKLFHDGQGQNIPGVPGTGWAAFNAVTEYVNHSKPVRGNNPTKRLEGSLFGRSGQLVTRATDLILQAA